MFAYSTGWLTAALAISSFVFGPVHAAAEDKTRLGNHTIDRTLQLRTHSIFAPYIDQDLQNRWWDFGADAYINTNKHVRLTRKVPSQMGWLWSRLALTASNFVIEVEFKVHGDSSHLFGDGLAIWLTRDRAEPGPVFGSKDEFTGLGIFLDTYANARHSYSFPRVVAMLGDGKTKYDFGNDGDEQALGGCSANFRRTNVATKLKITYVKDNFLDVKIQYKAWDDWTDCIYIEKISLPSNPFLGFSAMTGDVADWHDLISLTTYSVIMSPPNQAPNKMSGKTLDPSSSEGTWLGFLFKLALLAGVVAGGWYGYQEYQKRKRYGDLGGSRYGGSYNGMSSPRSAIPSSMGSAFVNSGGFPNTPHSANSYGGGMSSPLPSAGLASGGLRSAGFGDNYVSKRL